MSEVRLHINGRDYRVRARDGEEEKLERAGRLVNAKCDAARHALGAMSDASLFFYVSLMLADEQLEGAPEAPPPDEGATERANGLADRLEALAARLEQLGEDA